MGAYPTARQPNLSNEENGKNPGKVALGLGTSITLDLVGRKMARSRAWSFTHNNYTPEIEQALKTLECRYIVFGYEECPTTGTPHLQGYVVFESSIPFETAKKRIGATAHIEKPEHDALVNYRYCTKTREGDTPNEKVYEKGDRPLSQKEKGAGEKRKWGEVMEHAKAGDMAWIMMNQPKVFIQHGKMLEHIHARYGPRPEPLVHRKVHTWIWGVADSGKVHHAKHLEDLKTPHPSCYVKKADKWFCHYDGEERVVVMEWAPKHYQLSEDLKEWADKWPFRAEGKGTSMTIRPKEIWICSNYSIEQCFSDPETVAALNTRFNVVYLSHAYVPPETVGFDF